MKLFRFLSIAAIALALAAPGLAHAKSAKDFVEKASIGNRFEVESSQLALSKSQDPAVRDFAQKMIDDHKKAQEELAAILPTSSVNIASANIMLDKKHQKKIEKLQELSGEKFDSKYLSMQKDAHEDAVDLFRDYAKSGDDGALRSFAQQTLPTLEQHYAEVKELKPSFLKKLGDKVGM